MLRQVGLHAYLLEIQTSCCSENRCQSVLWQRIIPVIGESFPPGGVISALGVNDRGVTHAGESFTPLRGRSLTWILRYKRVKFGSFVTVRPPSLQCAIYCHPHEICNGSKAVASVS